MGHEKLFKMFLKLEAPGMAKKPLLSLPINAKLFLKL